MKTQLKMVWVSIALLACTIPLSLRATTNYFIPNTVGAWDAAGNWSSGLAPTNTDLVYITNGSSHVILTNASSSSWLAVSNLSVGSSIWSSPGSGASLLINLSDPTKTFTVGSSANDGGLLIGQTGTGLLTVSNSNLSASYATIGGAGAALGGAWNIFGGTNTLRGSFLGGGYALQIGYGASSYGSTMLLDGGGVLNAVGNTIGIGNGASGLLTLSNGVVNAGSIRVGDSFGQAGAAGDYNIFSGTNSVTWSFIVGNAIPGRMLMNGGLILFTNGSQPFIIGNSAAGTGQLTISNGELRVGADMALGEASGANGVLRMYNGTNTVGGLLKVGDVAGSTGTVLLAGGQLAVTNASGTAQLVVGVSGKGSFTLSGGAVTADQLLVTNGANSAFSASGGTLTVKTATIGGSFSLTNSTASFSSNLTVTSAGSLSGTNGFFALYGNFINQSTNRTSFDLSRSTVFFTNAAGGTTAHTLSLSNSAAVDMGSNWMNVAQLATNFSIGTLRISMSNNLTVTGTKLLTTNALYVGWLDLSAWNTNAASLSATLSNALTLTDINLYYDASDVRNAYLQDVSYNIWGGGLLIPIPEPSTTGLILGGALLSTWFMRRRKE